MLYKPFSSFSMSHEFTMFMAWNIPFCLSHSSRHFSEAQVVHRACANLTNSSGSTRSLDTHRPNPLETPSNRIKAKMCYWQCSNIGQPNFGMTTRLAQRSVKTSGNRVDALLAMSCHVASRHVTSCHHAAPAPFLVSPLRPLQVVSLGSTWHTRTLESDASDPLRSSRIFRNVTWWNMYCTVDALNPFKYHPTSSNRQRSLMYIASCLRVLEATGEVRKLAGLG